MNISNRKTTVLFLEDAIGYGGAAICLKLFLKQLDKSRHRSLVVTTHPDPGFAGFNEVAEWRPLKGALVSRKALRKWRDKLAERFGSSGLGALNRLVSITDYAANVLPHFARILLLAKKERVDLMHLNNDPVCNMAGLMVARALKIPCISHVRGPCWDLRISSWLAKNVNYVITVSDWVRDEIIKLGVAEERVERVWDGLDLKPFLKVDDVEDVRAELGLKPGQLTFGMTGRLNPWKGHRVFIEACEKVIASMPNCKALIIGGASEKHKGYAQALKHMVRSKGLTNHVLFLGQRNDMARVIQMFDVIVHASIAPEPLGNVIIEAMAAAKPLIATNLGGPREMIENDQTGILIPPKDPDILASKICELLQSQERRKKLGENARHAALEKFTIERYVLDIQHIYEKVLDGRVSKH